MTTIVTAMAISMMMMIIIMMMIMMMVMCANNAPSIFCNEYLPNQPFHAACS